MQRHYAGIFWLRYKQNKVKSIGAVKHQIGVDWSQKC